MHGRDYRLDVGRIKYELRVMQINYGTSLDAQRRRRRRRRARECKWVCEGTCGKWYRMCQVSLLREYSAHTFHIYIYVTNDGVFVETKTKNKKKKKKDTYALEWTRSNLHIIKSSPAVTNLCVTLHTHTRAKHSHIPSLNHSTSLNWNKGKKDTQHKAMYTILMDLQKLYIQCAICWRRRKTH